MPFKPAVQTAGVGGRQIARNSLFNAAGQVLPLLAAVATIPTIVRGLGTDGYGILSIALVAIGYFSVLDMGLSRATVKFVAEHLSPERIDRVPELVWTSLTMLVALGVVGASVGAALVPWSVTRFFKIPAGMVGEAHASLLILCLAIPVLLTNDAFRGVLEAAHRFDLVNWVRTPASVLFYLGAVVVLRLGGRVAGVIAFLALLRCATAIVYCLLALRLIPGLRAHFRPTLRAFKQLASFGGWVMVSNSAAPVFTYVERLVIASVLSIGLLTYYAVPLDVMTKCLVFPASIAPVLFPVFSRQLGIADLQIVMMRAVKFMIFVMTPICGVLFAFARQIFTVWMGSSFAARSAPVMRLLAIAFFFNALAAIPVALVQGMGRPQWKAIEDLLFLPAYVVVCILLTLRYGINGAASAKLLFSVLDCVALYAFATFLGGCSAATLRSSGIGETVGLCIALTAGLVALGGLGYTVVAAVVLAGIAIGGYAFLFWRSALQPPERSALLAFWPLKRARQAL